VACITSSETRTFDKGGGEDPDISEPFSGDGVSQTGASRERDSRVSSSSSSKPDNESVLGDGRLVGICEAVPLAKSASAPCLRGNLLGGMSSVWTVVNAAFNGEGVKGTQRVAR